MVLIRKKELTQYDIAPRQLYVLHIIHALGAMATASTVAWEVDREVHVINKLVINLERAGLIKRIKNSPKSQHLRLESIDKGIDMLKVSQKCTTIIECFVKWEEVFTTWPSQRQSGVKFTGNGI